MTTRNKKKLEFGPLYKGFSIIFPKILDAIQRFTKVRNFPLSNAFSSPK